MLGPQCPPVSSPVPSRQLSSQHLWTGPLLRLPCKASCSPAWLHQGPSSHSPYALASFPSWMARVFVLSLFVVRGGTEAGERNPKWKLEGNRKGSRRGGWRDRCWTASSKYFRLFGLLKLLGSAIVAQKQLYTICKWMGFALFQLNFIKLTWAGGLWPADPEFANLCVRTTKSCVPSKLALILPEGKS